ncbi:MAG: RNA-directed DNA polymerase, partial [Gammaproteobacteria bacterium]|nr:RNA-directed DNA polymerase [Gammaproteobacteria bacterium]
YDKVLRQYPTLLSDKMGLIPGVEHTITLASEARPIAQKLRPIPLSRRDAVDKELQRMVDADIWEPVDKSDWAHHLVSVPKPSGEIRITTDLSPLNVYVTPNRFPLPTINELFLELKGARLFSKLDLKKTFFHIKLAEQSRPLTTTLTHKGLFQYKRLPMGLKDSASVCQQLVAQTLASCPVQHLIR